MGHPPSSPIQSRYPTRRRLVAAILCAPVAAQAAPCREPRVLFVCPAGTVKSAIARDVLRSRARRAAVAVQVESRGLHPEDHVSPGLAANLRRGGIELAPEPARALTDSDVARADIVIAFDEATRAPALRNARSWEIPSWNGDYPAAKAALSARIDGLLEELASGRLPCRDGP
jgi:protein-tyrosine-phosphatase